MRRLNQGSLLTKKYSRYPGRQICRMLVHAFCREFLSKSVFSSSGLFSISDGMGINR